MWVVPGSGTRRSRGLPHGFAGRCSGSPLLILVQCQPDFVVQVHPFEEPVHLPVQWVVGLISLRLRIAVVSDPFAVSLSRCDC